MSATGTQLVHEQNKTIVRRWFEEVWNQSRLETASELLAEEGVIQDGEITYRGPKEFGMFYYQLRTAFSDFDIKPILDLAEGDLACLHWSADFRHAASDKPVHVTGTSVVRIAKGPIVEAWQNWDAASLGERLKRYGIS